jgi:hypothetical protein
MKTVTATFCLETPAFGRGRVACGDRQKVAVTVFLREVQVLPVLLERDSHGEADRQEYAERDGDPGAERQAGDVAAGPPRLRGATRGGWRRSVDPYGRDFSRGARQRLQLRPRDARR